MGFNVIGKRIKRGVREVGMVFQEVSVSRVFQDNFKGVSRKVGYFERDFSEY